MDNEKIKIFLLFQGRGLSGVDMRNPLSGNPGVGGTEYCFLLLAYCLKEMASDRFDVGIVSYEPLRLPSGIVNTVVAGPESLPSSLNPGSILIVKQSNDLALYDILERCSGVKAVTWAHNYIFGPAARRMAKSKTVCANVFVSKQMYDFYVDDDIASKSLPIPNIVPDVDAPAREMPSSPTLTYMGQVSEAKGILTLMKIWQIVSRKYPEANLNIIGGGNLYNRNEPLGELGIAAESTEKKLLPYITDAEGNLSSKVHFLGIMGKEKYEVFSRSTVGIVNPGARTETFGMGIIEMASSRLPVVTKNWNGHPDTALNGQTALLSYTVRGMAADVCRLFRDRKLNEQLGENAKREVARFSPEAILPLWIDLLEKVDNGKQPDFPPAISRPYTNNYKFLRAANRFLRQNLRLRFLPSIVGMESRLYKLIKG